MADSADAMELMGQEWVEDKFQKVAALVGSGVSKTYLSGLTQIVDFLSGEPGQIELVFTGLEIMLYLLVVYGMKLVRLSTLT